jgi:hypothetical protein
MENIMKKKQKQNDFYVPEIDFHPLPVTSTDSKQQVIPLRMFNNPYQFMCHSRLL